VFRWYARAAIVHIAVRSAESVGDPAAKSAG